MTTQSISCAAVLNESEQNKSLKRVNEKLLAENQKLKTENATCKTENGALLKANEKLLAENQRLKVEVGTFRFLISQMKDLRERELSESSESESEGEEEEEDVHPTSDGSPSKIVLNSVCDTTISHKPGSLDSAASDGETGDVEMETPEHPDEADEDELSDGGSIISDDENNILHSHSKVHKPNALWKCDECRKEIRGKRYHRFHHIAAHENLKLHCPIAKCTARLCVHSFRPHLVAHHKMKSGNLSKEERKRQNQERIRCYMKAWKLEKFYFPQENLLKILKEKSVAKKKCKKCDQLASSDSVSVLVCINICIKVYFLCQNQLFN